ncbi:MAG: NTF2-like N-terminal transpeptidase domain-containing protein, partial [Mycobacterium sp.]
MATSTSKTTRVTGLLLAVVTAGASLSACTPRPDGPAPAAEQFFADLGRGDTGAAAALSDHPSEAHAALNEAWTGLQATHLDAKVLGSRYTEDAGSVNYRFTWELPKKRTWTYDGVLNMIRDEGRW